MTKTRLVLRLDAGPVGLGHAARVSGILAALGPGFDPVLVGTGQGLENFFSGLARIDSAKPLSELCLDLGAEALLIDIPVYPPGFFDDVRKLSIPVVCIDDVGGEVDADLIVNGTILEDYHRYPKARPSCEKLLGGLYTLLRPAFGSTPWKRPSAPSVTIIVGSGPRARDWAHWLLRPGLAGPEWGRVTMVVGAAFADPEALSSRTRAAGITLRQGLQATEMAELLSGSSICLITGGMILYEALATGIPAVVFPQIPNLIPEAEWLGSRGYIENLGFEGGFDQALVKDRVEALLADPEGCAAMSNRQRELIDGRGIERAAQAIRTLVLERGPG